MNEKYNRERKSTKELIKQSKEPVNAQTGY
jgi:hypothetical protein